MRVLSRAELEQPLQNLKNEILRRTPNRSKKTRLFGVPRGGVVVSLLLNTIFPEIFEVVFDPIQADCVVDDITDSGGTAKRYQDFFPEKPFCSLFIKGENAPVEWIRFPWETETEEREIFTRLIELSGEDIKREGLQRTPERAMEYWNKLTSGYSENPEKYRTCFEETNTTDLVILKGISFWSLCEHHLAPFFGHFDVGYLPKGRVIGLSKISRIIGIFSRRLQVQERLVTQVADSIFEIIQPQGIAVVCTARHSCMESRGIQKSGIETVTSKMLGTFLSDSSLRSEFLQLSRR